MEKLITSRPQRNRRHSRRAWPPEDDLQHARPIKRLFTPEIKRMLKDWLVRRRENPYPSREEKKRLAIDTGLTYTQICNWFANWRRKLKNSERERTKKGSWGHLIKHYNTNAKGNVEQFSISSEDSIWEEDEYCTRDDMIDCKPSEEHTISDGTDTLGIRNNFDISHKLHYFTDKCNNGNSASITLHSTVCAQDGKQLNKTQQITNADEPSSSEKLNATTFNTAKYKQKMMEKYLRDTHVAQAYVEQHEIGPLNDSAPTVINTIATIPTAVDADGTELSKWLKSAACFRPDKNNYFIEWNVKTGKMERRKRSKQVRRTIVNTMHSNSSAGNSQLHQTSSNNPPTQLELDAAEALANLAFNCRQRILDVENTTAVTMKTVDAISS